MYLSPFYVNLILEFSYHPKPPLRDGQFPTPATNRRIIYLFGLKEATIAAPARSIRHIKDVLTPGPIHRLTTHPRAATLNDRPR